MSSNPSPTTEGKADFHVGEETYQTWYKVVGDLKSGKRPLVTLHGGPGSSHHYLSSLIDLVTKYDIPIVLYDQLGGGSSTYLADKPSDFWTPELFMDELENIVKHLGISSDYDLLGHSWGGMLAAQFAAQRPQAAAGVKRLIISDSPASMVLWEEVAEKLIDGMPQDVQDTLKKHEDAGTTDSKEYHDAMMVFYAKHLCRVDPMPEDVQKSFEMMEKYPVVYNTMNGPSEFHIIGTMKPWGIVDDLHKITQPALILNGRYDEAQDPCVAPYFTKIPKAKWVTFAESSHMPHWEERERYMQVVGDFLTLV